MDGMKNVNGVSVPSVNDVKKFISGAIPGANITGISQSIDTDAIINRMKASEIRQTSETKPAAETQSAVDPKRQQDLERYRKDLETKLAAWKEFNGLIISVLAGINFLVKESLSPAKITPSPGEEAIKAAVASTEKKDSRSISIQA